MGELTVSFIAVLAVVGLVIVSHSVGEDIAHKKFTQHCSLTNTYIIDDDTVIVCRVVKRGEPEAKGKKPEEQSL
jgi:hypothetical protein